VTEPADPPAPPLRTWRPMAAWTAGILLAAGLVWFVAAVVVPVWQVRAAVRRTRDGVHPWNWYPQAEMEREVRGLGSPEQATGRLLLYLRLPWRWAPDRTRAVHMLGFCGPSAAPPLLKLLGSRDHNTRAAAALALGETKDPRAVDSLAAFLDDRYVDSLLAAAEQYAAEYNKSLSAGELPMFVSAKDFVGTRLNAVEALGKIGGEEAVKALTGALTSKDDSVRAAAAEALKKIRGEETKQ
jgi:HEAT repeat protein